MGEILSKLIDFDNSVKMYCTDLQGSTVKRKTNFKVMSLVNNLIFNKLNNIFVANSFSPTQGNDYET